MARRRKTPAVEAQTIVVEAARSFSDPAISREPSASSANTEFDESDEEHWDTYSPRVKKTAEQKRKEKIDKELKKIKEEIEKNLKGWPWKECPQKLLTCGPFAFNYTVGDGQNSSPRFKLPQILQKSSLLKKLFSNDIVARTLLSIIFKQHSSAWKFYSSCQEVTAIYDYKIHLWDMNGTLEHGGYFHNCEKDRFGPNAPTDSWNQGSVASIIVIAPFRRASGPASYYEQVQNLHTMSIAMSNFADNLQNLQIHRNHFLTPQLLALLIPKMTNLKVLGIYQCQLLSVSEIFRLLDIIKTDRPLGRENQIYLDFFPTWHQGPKCVDDDTDMHNTHFAGTYGVTWDNTDMDHCRAIWGIVIRALPIALAQNIDLTSKGTAFRQWLDKGLLWRVEETLEAMLDPGTDPRKLVALADSRNPDHEGQWQRFSNDAVIGCRPEGYERYVTYYRCNHCNTHLFGIFFKYGDLYDLQAFNENKTREANLTCLGCKLKFIFFFERDHFKREKRRLMRAWLHSGPVGDDQGEWNTADLRKALSDFHTRRIILKADALDQKRLEAMNMPNRKLRHDPEYDARQTPIPYQSYGKHGFQKRSPTADVPEKKAGERSPWDWVAMCTRNAHMRCD
ncbi:hypothetical protein WAI453_011355 [Rhynchosporium graminicola]|uniref:Uncharacterized protein n=1 Tax=Rhynchosporium graminicola TaxID=2792576 RepID=A0A1E1KBH0_9HELO|nr:uncharacterized protein RCO7_05737 [Rhynchosporium commune]